MPTSDARDDQAREPERHLDPAPSSARNPLGPILESFLRRFRDGERPALTEYIGGYPELADEIRELFPALVEIEQLGSLGGAAASAGSSSADPRRASGFQGDRSLRSRGPDRRQLLVINLAHGPSGWATTALSAASARGAWAWSTRRCANRLRVAWP